MPGPLLGKKILLTREKGPSNAMARDILAIGGIPVVLPLIKIISTDLMPEEKEVIHQSDEFDWIVFTSPNGVRHFMAQVKQLGASLSGVKIAVVGKKTAQTVNDYGLNVELIPNEYTAENLAKLFMRNEEKGISILLPLGNLAKPFLEQQLQEAGYLTKRVNVYKTVMNDEIQTELIKVVKEESIDCITFASPSSIEFFLSMTKGMDLNKFFQRTAVACIGKVSADFARTHGLQPRIVPDNFTAQCLVEAIAEFYSATS